MKVRFVKAGHAHGYSFEIGECCNLPKEVARTLISHGIVVREIDQYETTINGRATEAIKEAKRRDDRHRNR